MNKYMRYARQCFTCPFVACVILITLIGMIPDVYGITPDNPDKQADQPEVESNNSPHFSTIYRIKLRVHLSKSGRTPQKFLPIFAEINDIWWSQAGICFEIHTVNHEKPLADGFDMWFAPNIGGFNGYYDGEYIQMTDEPVLGFAPNPAKFSAARTAAHELGHALGLPHRQNSDDNLMRSKTYGWLLNKQEVESAREAAANVDHLDTAVSSCGKPRIY